MSLTQQQINNAVTKVREIANVFLIDTAELHKYVREDVLRGESTIIYSAPVNIRCRLITRSGTSKVNVAAQERTVSQTVFYGQYRMQIEPDLDISVKDKIILDGRTFIIEYVPPDHAFAGSRVIALQEVI